MLRHQKNVALALAALLGFMSLVGCGGKASPDQEQQNEPEEQATQIANPFVDCDSAYEAAQLAGFEVTFPESVPDYPMRTYQAVEGEMVQCFYTGEGDGKVLIRKAVGDEDISGDYNEYAVTNEVTVGGVTLTERGDGTLVHVATWTKDGYTFAIDADDGLDAETIENLAAATM